MLPLAPRGMSPSAETLHRYVYNLLNPDIPLPPLSGNPVQTICKKQNNINDLTHKLAELSLMTVKNNSKQESYFKNKANQGNNRYYKKDENQKKEKKKIERKKANKIIIVAQYHYVLFVLIV